ncbi:MAG: DUF1501 domain-containing protein [Verrucomicrobiales bacterium]|nr:DUF1501 domain-containing protein [Verrucomicrobiales bacterium]
MNAFKDDQSRRQFINRAAKTFLGVSAAGGGMSLPAITQAAGKGASELRQIATAKRVIYLYMNGGMSHLDTFDPKPGHEVMGPTGTINTNVDGMRFSEYLPRISKQADKLAVINSMTSTQGAHKQGNYMMHTSYELRSSIRHPAMGAWLLKFQGKRNQTLPGNVMIGNDSNHPGAGFFESKLSPVMISNPAGGLQNTMMHRGMNDDRFNFHLDLAQKLDQPFVEKYDQKNVRAYTDMYDDAIKLMKSSDLAAFDISEEPEWLRDRYGDNNFGQGCLLARRLIENDVRFVEVTYGSWDTHNANFVNLPDKAEVLDQGLSTLLFDLEKRGLLDDTLVVLATEFGRTPEINQNEGRDHHPQAFSCLLAGGGIRGGQVLGKSDDRGANIEDSPVKIPDLNATIGYALGLPLNQVLYSPSKRPFTVADKGKPLAQLFG